MRDHLVAGAMLLALTAAAPAAIALPCAAPQGVWGPFEPLAQSRRTLDATHTLKIVALGSSSTYGTGATVPERSYPAQLAAILRGRFPLARIEVVNAGIGGETVAGNLARLERDVIALRPDLVIWQVGTNDAFQKKSAAEVRTGILQGVGSMRDAGAEIVLMETQYLPERPETEALLTTRAAVHAAAAEADVLFLPRYALMRHWIASGEFSPATMLVADKIHMTDASYRCLALRVADLLPAGDAAPAGDVVAVAGTVDEANSTDSVVVSH